MRTDAQLQTDITRELEWDPRVNEKEIAIAVRDGVVTLAGNVDNFAQKYAAERAAERVSGVRAVADDLTVRLPGSENRSDTEIAHAVADALTWNVEVPNEGVKAAVDKGWVTLDGKVQHRYQREAAERAARYLTGVKGVTNLLVIAPKRSAWMEFEVGTRIKEALRRNSELDAKNIEVEAADGTVILTGTVHSWAERSAAEQAAWRAPGVHKVDDRLGVTV